MTSFSTPTRARKAFTLAEVMIGATISAFVLTAMMTSFLMLGRSGTNLANYSMMETQARRALEDFSQDLRMASNVAWNSSTSITLTVPNNYTSTSNLVTYAWDSSSSGATAKSFYRMPGNAAASNAKTVLANRVVSFEYLRYNRLDAAAANEAETKRIVLTMQMRSTGVTLADTTNNVISASFILRNKPIT